MLTSSGINYLNEFMKQEQDSTGPMPMLVTSLSDTEMSRRKFGPKSPSPSSVTSSHFSNRWEGSLDTRPTSPATDVIKPMASMSESLETDRGTDVSTSETYGEVRGGGEGSTMSEPSFTIPPPGSSFDWNKWQWLGDCHCRIRSILDRLGITVPGCDIPDFKSLRDMIGKAFLSNKEYIMNEAPLLEGEDALDLMNLLDDITLMEYYQDSQLLILLQSCIRKIARRSGKLPSSLFLSHLTPWGGYPYGGGGFADVWIGHHKGEIKVAMKVLRTFAAPGDDQTLQQEYCQEALVWRQLSHPRILPFLGVSVDAFPRRLCLVSLWMENGNIRNYLKVNKDAKPLVLLKQVAEGLQFLHSRHFCHGDIKAANVLINKHGEACLSDMGLTTLSASQAFHTARNLDGAGSTRWMAPEMFTEESEISYATDMYAFAMMMYEVLIGKAPFYQLGEFAVITSIVRGDRPTRPNTGDAGDEPFRTLESGTWDRTWSLMESCWSPDPILRGDMKLLLSKLDALGTRTRNIDRRSPLSPYTYHVVYYHGRTYYSAYHLWESMKYEQSNPELAKEIRRCPRYNNLVVLLQSLDDRTKDAAQQAWTSVMLEKMEQVLHLKFKQHPDARAAILATGNDPLTFISSKDLYWGCSSETGKGKNYLGKCLMHVREQLRAETGRN